WQGSRANPIFYVFFVYARAWASALPMSCPFHAARVVEMYQLRVKSPMRVTLTSFRGSKPKPTFARNKRCSNRGVDSAFPDPSGQLERLPLPRAPLDRSPLGFSTVAIPNAAAVHHLLCPVRSSV